MEVISEPSSLDQQVGVTGQTSTFARPGELSEEFRKLFNLKQTPLFNIPCGSDIVHTPLSVSKVSVASSISTTEGLSTTSVPLSSLVSRVDSCRTTSVSAPSSRTSVLTSSSSTTSSVVCSSPSVVEEEVRLGRDGILGQQGEYLSASKLSELSSTSFSPRYAENFTVQIGNYSVHTERFQGLM